ncbi:uncharacterized protein NECHADRAFT_75208 [Fusarium vanettenii 77-13-4]|uniref:Uncharacterized protein n=1 Tax=Fusarium vanettenii (strain ATCC MYA-4622 / CBS 123669 / FGSC 9596 / NRRL 45880 / 77-13-4) TaxID=660122 RepID=C7YI62_FUSV7|nr:uncharacterized protein NECHADRAFT_75208 [Fusarium vanettenii 77-13-4]EEU48042.1 hypothetical protein NECHADRAFT_75208 [Fusarium vanettenii 77-13-4]
MCIKHVNVCCHCGELLEPHWVSCNFHLLLSRTALSQIPPLEEPLHSQCPYQKSNVRPTLRGCVNSDSCPSWLWGLTEGLGEAEDESREVTEAQEEVARAKYEEYKKEFAKNHYTRRSPPIRKNFGEFLETALDDLPSPDPEYNSDDYFSLTDDDEGQELLSEACSLGSLSGSMSASSAPPGLGVHFEINPELLTQENVPAKKDVTDTEIEPPSAENLAKEYRDLVAPIWAWFFSNDSDPDTEAS